jgi:hypothetical protein
MPFGFAFNAVAPFVGINGVLANKLNVLLVKPE